MVRLRLCLTVSALLNPYPTIALAAMAVRPLSTPKTVKSMTYPTRLPFLESQGSGSVTLRLTRQLPTTSPFCRTMSLSLRNRFKPLFSQRRSRLNHRDQPLRVDDLRDFGLSQLSPCSRATHHATAISTAATKTLRSWLQRRSRSHDTALRSLTGIGCSTCSTSALLDGAECNHPTVFTVPPLLTSNDQSH